VEKRLIKMTILAQIIVFLLVLFMISANAQHLANVESSNYKSINKQISENIDIIIFISPQYFNDIEILNSINNYKKIVKDDIGWESKIIFITKEKNNYLKIDEIIEENYKLYKIKACIMVGEDIDTPIGGRYKNIEKPSIIPWSTIGGEDAYKVLDKKIISKPYNAKICISLLYPPSELSYEVKKTQIIQVFQKFSENREQKYNNKILVMESSSINKESKHIYQSLNKIGNLNYQKNPDRKKILETLNQDYSLYMIHGHSNPLGTNLNLNKEGWFSAENIDSINAPFFAADGCYVNGWTNDLEKKSCYYSKIFTSKKVKVMALGLLSQNGLETKVSFVENTLPDLVIGKTIAESVIGNIYIDCIIFGDPTFHYSFF